MARSLHMAVVLAAVCLTTAPTVMAAGLVTVDIQQDGIDGVEGMAGAARGVISPDGRSVYVTAVQDDALVVFDRDPATGRLHFVQAVFDGVGGVSGLQNAAPLAISPDGRHVYAGGYDSHALAIFERNATTGVLSLLQVLHEGVDGVDGLSNVQGFGMSPDGESLYVVSYEVAVFRRNVTTGSLTFVEIQEDDVAGVEGLYNPVNATVSPDGAHVYVTCTTGGNAVVVFARDLTTGALTFVEVQRDGVGGVDGLGQAEKAAVSPDGAHVYVAAFGDDAVALFERDPGTGHLSFVEALRDGVGGVDGLDGADTVTVSPDGAYVYVGTYGESAATMLRRDPLTGRLTFVQSTSPDFDGSIFVSPDGRHVYATSYLGRVTAFRPFTLECTPAPAAGCEPAASRKSWFSLRDGTSGADQLAWKWTASSAIPEDFGDPTTDTDYALCIYDASFASQPIAGPVAPADGGCRANRPCWRATGTTGFRMGDRDGRPQGLVQAALQQSSDKVRLAIREKGASLYLPGAPLQLPVRVQLQRGGSTVCWEATFSTTAVNEPGRFKAGSD